jgi:hypothetical protein
LLTIDADPTHPSLGGHNTPAAGSWTLYLIYTLQNATYPNEIWIGITFLPTGDIDRSRTTAANLTTANVLLEPFTALIRTVSPTFDLWKLINWTWVSFYWLILIDFGQIAPTTYSAATVGFGENRILTPILSSSPNSFTSQYNIFVNETLFQIYHGYLRNDLLPIFQASRLLPPFSPLNHTNRIHSREVYFQRSYSCLQRQWKGGLEALVSVFAADYALFFGVYSAALVIAGLIQKRREDGMSLIGLTSDNKQIIVKVAQRRRLTAASGRARLRGSCNGQHKFPPLEPLRLVRWMTVLRWSD